MEYTPHYREETIPGAWALLEELLIPKVLGKDLANPEQLWSEIAGFRGNKMAKAALEMAFWDLWCKSLGQPLWKVLGGVRAEIPVGISLGIEPSIEATLEKVGKGLADGYKRIKLKIKPGWDVRLAMAVREAYPEANLTVDANSAYSLNHISTFKALDAAGLDYIEQPLAFDDIVDHAKLQAAISTSICLDESITSPEDARKALEIGAGRVINLKPGRVGASWPAARCTTLPRATDCRSGWAECWKPALAGPPTFTWPPCPCSSNRAIPAVPAATGRRTSSKRPSRPQTA